jgi:hypothetical protein
MAVIHASVQPQHLSAVSELPRICDVELHAEGRQTVIALRT